MIVMTTMVMATTTTMMAMVDVMKIMMMMTMTITTIIVIMMKNVLKNNRPIAIVAILNNFSLCVVDSKVSILKLIVVSPFDDLTLKNC